MVHLERSHRHNFLRMRQLIEVDIYLQENGFYFPLQSAYIILFNVFLIILTTKLVSDIGREEATQYIEIYITLFEKIFKKLCCVLE